MHTNLIHVLFCTTIFALTVITALNGASTVGLQLYPPVCKGQLKEFGLLKHVEDAGYPIVVLTIEFPERGFSEYFNLNLEQVKTIDAGTLTSAVGHYVSFEYQSDIVHDLIDLTMHDISLLEESVSTSSDAELKYVTGILSNAAEVTSSDLPGELYIKTEEEVTYVFPCYITSKIVQANGKTVMALYQERTLNTITSIRISD